MICKVNKLLLGFTNFSQIFLNNYGFICHSVTSSRTSDCFSASLLEAPRIRAPDICSFSALQKPGILQGMLLQESVIFILSHPFY